MDYWHEVARAVGGANYDRAWSLNAAGRVTLVELDAGSAETSVDAVVRDLTSHGDDVLVVSLEIEPARGTLSAYCSCEHAPGCTHVCAVLLALSDADPGTSTGAFGPAAGGRGGSGPRQTVPPWQRALDGLLPASDENAVELCVFITVQTPPTTRWNRTPPSPSLVARPGMRGTRGAWIKGQARWGHLDGLRADPGALALLRELDMLDADSYSWGYNYRDQEWMHLDRLPSRTLWSLLTDLQAAGVALVSPGKAQHPVRLDGEPMTPRITVAENRKRLSVRGELVGAGGADGESGAGGAEGESGSGGESGAGGTDADTSGGELLFVGAPPIAIARVAGAGTAGERIVLHPIDPPLSEPMRELLTAAKPISIDTDGRDRFESDYLPRLHAIAPVTSPDGSYAVPAPPRAVLELRVDHGDGQAHLTWRWDRLGGSIRPDPIRESGILEAVRRAAGAHAETVVQAAGTDASRSAAPPDQTLRGAAAVLFVAEVLPGLRTLDGLHVIEDVEAPSFRAAAQAPDVSVTAQPGTNDWFDLSVQVSIEGEEVDFATLFRALSDNEPILVLPSGTYFPLDTPELQRLRDIIAEASALSDRPITSARVSRYQADLWEELVELGVVARQEIEWWMRVRGLNNHDQLTAIEPPHTLRADLRDYQRTGLSWLHFLRTHQLGGVLADDMGLGKTLQTIAMIEKARVDALETGDAQHPPFLIVAPTSVVGNWAAECARFAPDLRVATITATGNKRGAALGDEVAGAHVVVTSYALFRLEFDAYAALDWQGLILDEAQQIKNPSSQGYKCARMLDAPFTLVITGTPLENNLLELWALVSLACPGLLGGRRTFTEHFRTPIERERDNERLRTLQRRIRPFLLRRTKELVVAELPPKQEQELVLDLHPTHRRLYDRRLARERQKVLGLVDDVEANRFQIFRSLTLLRQLSLAPDLVDEGDAPSAKLDALVGLLREASAEGHRALVLSQFTRFLTRARDAATDAGIASLYLDGSTTNRPAVIDQFRTGDAPAFFVSLKAGGVGLNLVEADYVILLDPWWNPAVEAQAIDRSHRIGQTRPVIVYRLISKGTIEEKVMALKTSKAQLFDRVLDTDGDAIGGGLSADDIRSLVD
ncbi:SNF2-related protein [Microbacterium sp. bgisy207]|uniref:SNF2-related protein n=1 Tax=Microbacterium sp. bgisy207 TaxID=3413800 RepID=UPI003EBD0C23